MIWSLRFHNRDGGFYSHYEYASTEAYRWPGFVNGDPYNERMVMSFLRDKAYALDGMIPPRLPVPQPPMLLPITDPSRISWKGSVGALYYQVEREAVNDTGWLILDRKVDESRYQYRPDFCDDSAKAGVNYSYRVRAVNESGASECSNTVGPILVKTRTMVDEMEDFSRTFQKDGDLRLLSMQDVRRSREDRSRLTGNDGSYVVYKYPADVQAVRIEWLKSGPDAGVNVWVADSSFHFRNISTNDEQFVFPKNDYRIYDAVSSSLKNLPEGIRYVKIELKGGVFIDRVEVTGVAK
jgi:hypothetical protein